jgi:hypothetical protein
VPFMRRFNDPSTPAIGSDAPKPFASRWVKPKASCVNS